MSITFNAPARPFVVEFFGDIENGTVNDNIDLQITDAANAIVQLSNNPQSVVATAAAVAMRVRLPNTNYPIVVGQQYTFKIRMASGTNGQTAGINAGAAFPASLSAITR